MTRHNTAELQVFPATNPKATGSNPVGRAPPNTEEDSDSTAASAVPPTRTGPLGTPVGHAEYPRQDALGSAGHLTAILGALGGGGA